MAWIATEGHTFNHATDRVPDVDAAAAEQRALGRRIKASVEVSRAGSVRQTAFEAVRVWRTFIDEEGAEVQHLVPGSGSWGVAYPAWVSGHLTSEGSWLNASAWGQAKFDEPAFCEEWFEGCCAASHPARREFRRVSTPSAGTHRMHQAMASTRSSCSASCRPQRAAALRGPSSWNVSASRMARTSKRPSKSKLA